LMFAELILFRAAMARAREMAKPRPADQSR
jgi:hypothetical protein